MLIILALKIKIQLLIIWTNFLW